VMTGPGVEAGCDGTSAASGKRCPPVGGLLLCAGAAAASTPPGCSTAFNGILQVDGYAAYKKLAGADTAWRTG